MAKINYHGRKFRGISNTPNGQVSGNTIFCYAQIGDKLEATYSGGSILEGHMIGHVHEDNSLEFVYHHIDDEGVLKSGHCKSTSEILNDGRIRLHETWVWTFGGEGKGNSVIEEIGSEGS
jgi:hypothetical protein